MARHSLTLTAGIATVLLCTVSAAGQSTSGWGSGPATVSTVGWGAAPAKTPAKTPAKAPAKAPTAAPVHTSAAPPAQSAAAKPPSPLAKPAHAAPARIVAVWNESAETKTEEHVADAITLRWPNEPDVEAPAAHGAEAGTRTVLIWTTEPVTIDVLPPAPAPAPAPVAAEPAQPPPPAQITRAPQAAAPRPTAISHRWVDAQTLTFATRYRYVDTTAGVVTSNQLQHSEALKVRFTFDPAGRYAVVAGLGTGTSFTGGWNNAGVGTPNDLLMTMSLKQLYVSASPWKGLEAQYGGLYFVRGEGTEITTYDNDAYLAGERLSVKRPDLLYVDEVSATAGYVGDLSTLNFLRRSDRLSETNYYQFLVGKKFGKMLGVSGDLTSISGVRTARSAVSVKAPKTLGVDLLRVEGYHRFGTAANGYAVSAEKTLLKRLSLGVGTADIDLSYGGLNADRFGKGQRWFMNGTLTIFPELSLLTFYQHAFNNGTVSLSNRSRLDVILQFNALKALQRARWY